MNANDVRPVRQIVVIGGSSGAIDAMRTIIAGLPPDFAAPLCVVLHTSPMSPGILHEILGRSGRIPVSQAVNMERLRPGHVYVAPPDHHLLVEPGVVRVTRGPRENRFRPAIDPLFRSAAQVYGPGAIGVVLTGGLDDGTDGLWTVKQLGGVAIVQDPAEAFCPSMPEHAITHVRVDHVASVHAIAPLLVQLTTRELVESTTPAPAPASLQVEVSIAMEDNPIAAGLEDVGTPSIFTCPECQGVLLELQHGGTLPKFRCHTGHAYSLGSLVAAVTDSIEDTMWQAVRALDEGQFALERLAQHLRTAHGEAGVADVLERASRIQNQAQAVRQLILENESAPAAPEVAD
jgi:two-component system chemotaxis response regulator CheB